MALTRSTYTQGEGQRHQDVLIDPDTLAAGTLFQRFDRRAYPQVGVKFAGTLGDALVAPVLTRGAILTTGGTFTADSTYYWKVVAFNASGEHAVSNEISAACAASGGDVLPAGTVAMSWAAVPGAVSYKVYRGTAPATQDRLVATNTTVLTKVDAGAAGSAATIPAANPTGVVVPTPPRTTHGVGS